MAERSAGKDTTTGHWEMMGVVLDEPFPTYPDGFPPEVIDAFADAIGRGVLGNKPASGTEIIEELGAEHLATGKPIVYTSADSVFQIAAHEGVVPLEQLYAWCEQARALLKGEHAVGRVIARPFVGDARRLHAHQGPRATSRSRPPARRVLDGARARPGVRAIGVGKIEDIFAGRGPGRLRSTPATTTASIDASRRLGEAGGPAFVFTNLVDFDMVYGHRHDAEGYAALPGAPGRPPARGHGRRCGDDDWLFLTADHGCDPTDPRHRPHARVHARWSPSAPAAPPAGASETAPPSPTSAPPSPSCSPSPRSAPAAPSPATSADPPLIPQAGGPAGP